MTDKTDSKERADFEAWYIASTRESLPSAGDGWSDDQIRDSFMGAGTNGKYYRASGAQIAWEGWQARASLAASAGSEPVATIKSWTNGSYWRNYKVEWHRNDLPEGAQLYTHPSPTEGMVATDAMIDAGKKMLHNSNGRGAREKVERIFNAMISAAPPTTSAGSGKGG